MSDHQPEMRAFADALRADEPELDFDQLVFKIQRGDVEVPGFTALAATAGEHSFRGWARPDGTAVIIQRTSMGALLDAAGFAEDPPTIDDARLAGLLAWGYGTGFELATYAKQGELGLPHDLSCPPVRERRDDGSIVFRYALRKLDPEDRALMSMQIARKPDGKYRFDAWQLAPATDDADD